MKEGVITSPVPAETTSSSGFQQKLGLFDATMLVMGTMIGSGIFIVSSDIARDVVTAGWMLAIWVLTGVMSVIGALCYAELAAMMPHAGGQYVYLREAYSPLWGFLYGWTVFLCIQSGSIAAVAVGFAKFLGVLINNQTSIVLLNTDYIIYQLDGLNIHFSLPLPWLREPLSIVDVTQFTVTSGQIVAVIVVFFLSLLNCRGVQEGKWVQNIFTVAKTLALLALIVLGLAIATNAAAIRANTADWWQGITQTPKFHKVSEDVPFSILAMLMIAGGAMVGSLFSADSWNNVTFIAGEVKDPRRALPRSLIIGVGIVIVMYVLANITYMAALPLQGSATGTTASERGIDHAQDDRVATAVMELISPHLGTAFMAIAIMISTFGCVNGMILMGARLYYAMACDGLFFRSVGQLNRRGVPGVGLILQGIWSILLVFSGSYNRLLDFVMFAALLFYVLTVMGLFVLRWTRPQSQRPYRVWGYPFLPILYIILCAVIMLDLLYVKPEYTWPGLIIVIAGIPVYFFWRFVGGNKSLTAKELN